MKSCVPIAAIAILALATAVGAEQPDATEAAVSKIRAYDASGIRFDAVSVEGTVIRIRGNANENSDVARLMRYLDTHVGTPTLEYVKRNGGMSEFLLTVKRLK
ncbi:MAG: PilN domain-containing protein [Gammaproteobacteria bacterium]|nr:PilN domain-containing protein [Gammaproteobacteria bacterium]